MKNIFQKLGISLSLIYVIASGSLLILGLSQMPYETLTLNLFLGTAIFIYSFICFITFNRVLATEKVDHSQLIFEIIFTSIDQKTHLSKNQSKVENLNHFHYKEAIENNDSNSLQ